MPLTPEERDYLKMRYEEDAEHARHHEMLRATTSAMMVALITGLLAFATTDVDKAVKLWATGFLICGAGIIGTLFNLAHELRRKQHVQKLKGARRALEADLSQAVKDAVFDPGKSGPRLYQLWIGIYVLTSIIGIMMIVSSDFKDAAVRLTNR